MNIKPYIIPACFIFSGCSVGVRTAIEKKYSPLDSSSVVRVLEVFQPAPANAIYIGSVAIYDRMTIHCDSTVVFTAAVKEARKAGGNILKVTEHLYPDFVSTCHRIKAKILRFDGSQDSVFTRPEEKSLKPIQPAKTQHDSRVSLYYGWGYQTSKLPDNLNQFEADYLKALKSGSAYGGEYDYFVNQQTGIGIMLNFFHSSNSAYAAAQTTSGALVTGKLSDDIHILYVAPCVTFRFFSPTEMNAFLGALSIGYIRYTDESEFIDQLKSSASTVGFSYDLSYDFGLSRTTCMGLGFSWKIAVLNYLDVTENGVTNRIHFDNNNSLGIGHLDLSIGLRFR